MIRAWLEIELIAAVQSSDHHSPPSSESQVTRIGGANDRAAQRVECLKRQAWPFDDRKLCRPGFRHPGRQKRPSAVGLFDDKVAAAAILQTVHDGHAFTRTWVICIRSGRQTAVLGQYAVVSKGTMSEMKLSIFVSDRWRLCAKRRDAANFI